MSLKGIQKAAMLLTTLDASTAMELLKGQSQEMIHKIAMELSELDAQGIQNADQISQIAQEFCTTLEDSKNGGMHIKSFVNNLLNGTAGKEKAAELQAQMAQAVREKDPFIELAAATPSQISATIDQEPPQAISLVLSVLPPKLSTDVLNQLDPEKSQKVIWRMTQPGEVSPKTLRRIGEILCKRLRQIARDDGPVVAGKENVSRETLRKVAVLLSGLDKDKQELMLKEIEGRDEDTAKTVKALMVTWDDIPKIEDRSLQEYLRNIEPGILAQALHGADSVIESKIRTNISERASETVDEESALMGDPRKKDILTAREKVVNPLREANEAEELLFIEED